MTVSDAIAITEQAPVIKRPKQVPVVSTVLAYPGCPTLTYMIALRVTNTYEDADAFISFTGRKGSGKTTASLAFCEGLAEDIAFQRRKGEPPEQFFNIDHVKSVTEIGALELLSSGALKNENSVFLLDDTGTQWSARNFQSPINKTLNSILQICRIYKCVIVANFILQTHIDIQARGMADFRAQMLYKNVHANQAFFKFFFLEQGEFKGKPREYKKYLTWHRKRITKWVVGRPSPGLEAAYKSMRRENTDTFIEDASQRVMSILEKAGEDSNPKGPKANFTEKEGFGDLRDKVMQILNNPELSDREKTPTAIARKLKTTRYKVELAGDF